MKLIINCFSPDQFEISKADYKWVCIYLTVYIYGKWVEEIYKSIKEKEDAKEKKESDERIAKKAKIEEGKKIKEGKYRI
jgi:predicted nuclease of restriction endonuclease-like (RecB) superfamily